MEHKQLFFLIQRAQHCLNKMGDKVFQQVLGVSSAHLSALFYLMRHNDCLLKDLSAGLDLNNSAVTGLIRRMEMADLVVKRSCEQDGRAFRVKLTEKGLNVAKDASPILQKIHKLLSSDFTNGEMDTIIRFLATIIAVKEVEEVSILKSF